MPRISNRRYPERECKNPACDEIFEPHDRRQLYCEPQCRINASNDRRHEANNTRFLGEKISRRNSKILEKIWLQLQEQKEKIVSRDILSWEKFAWDAPMTVNKKNSDNTNVLWYYEFGIGAADKAGNNFMIFKRSK